MRRRPRIEARGWISLAIVADPEETAAARRPPPGDDLADEVERAQTPWTPLRALTGVWLAVVLTVAAVLVVVAVTLYLVSGGD